MASHTNAVLRPASRVVPNEKGRVSLRLVQAASSQALVGTRLIVSAHEPVDASDDQVAACRSLLYATQPRTITVMSFHPGLGACESDLRALAADRTIVGLAGISPDRENVTLVATAGALTRQSKLSLSSEDEALHVKRGSGLDIYVPDAEAPNAVRWAVLNCHDYTHVDLLKTLQEERIELLIVVTYNTATRLYWQYAIADVHRLFCYVAIANVAELGGSGVFAPFRRVGREKNAQIGAGGQIFGARGAGEFAVDVELDIEGIRSIRKEFSEHGFQAPQIQRSRGSIYTAMVPSEHYMDTLDRKAGAPELNQVSDIPTDWNVDKARIAVAQLNHIGLQAYIDSKYRIRNHPTCGNFEYLLLLKLAELETRCRNLGQTDSGSLLDLLAFPEVFIPRSFLGTLQSFSDRMGAIVVAGLDYPDGGEETNANECAVIRPRASPVFYRKITRSQYDAHRDNAGNRMPMRRGHELLRFVNDQGRGFGVLICYDFSHTDLMWNLNLLGREMPLDLTVVVAHNPFGDLYRSCCIADAHRFYQYILMCNVAEYGGSGVFGPVRTSGARQVILDAGKGIEAIALAELNLRDLHESRCSPDQGLHHGDFMRRPGVFQRRWP